LPLAGAFPDGFLTAEVPAISFGGPAAGVPAISFGGPAAGVPAISFGGPAGAFLDSAFLTLPSALLATLLASSASFLALTASP
jgi:hypothetical protein|tara:strand:- start:148 stop:396 length:249 start_codon:yes stop_codon:yes gene_type:complete